MLFRSNAYFYTYPNNVPLTLLLAGVLKLGRWITGGDSGVWLNLVQFAWLDTGIAVMAHHLRRQVAPLQANLFLILVTTSAPLYAYALNTYSDTVVLPAVYLVLVALFRFRRAVTWRQGLGRGLVLGLLLAVSYLFKANFIVLTIAVLLGLWLLPNHLPRIGWGKLGVTLLIALCFAGGLGANRWTQTAAGYQADPNRALPALSWIAMSWNPAYHGDYNKQDADTVIAAPTAQAKTTLAQEHLAQAFNQLGPSGVAVHLFRKAQLFLATGTFDSFQINSAFDRLPTAYRRHQPVCEWLLANLTQAAYCGLLLINLCWGWVQWRRRHFSASFWVGGLFALGLTAFHVIFWETEERYALPLLPLLLAGAASSFHLPERCPVHRPRVWSRTLVVSFSVLMVGALTWDGVVHTRPVTQLVDAVSQNEGRYYQDHRIRLRAGQHLTQPFTAPVTFNRLVVDPNRGTRGQLTLETRQGKLIWRSAKQISLANVKLPDQPAGTYQLRVTNSNRQPLAVVTAPANYPLLPHALRQHPHQYLRFVARHAALVPLLTPKRYALFASLWVLLTASLGAWYVRWWKKITN